MRTVSAQHASRVRGRDPILLVHRLAIVSAGHRHFEACAFTPRICRTC
jgi:hypothetical protein